MAGFAPIQTVDVGGLLGVYEGARDRRVRQMLLERQIANEDRETKRQEGLIAAYAKLRSPTAQPKGGDPASTGSGAATTPPAAAPVPGIASAYGSTPHRSPLDPTPDPALAAPAVSAAPAPAQAALPAPPQTWVDANKDVISEMMALDPKEAFVMQTHLKEMDDEALKRAQASSAELAKAARHLTSFTSIEARRAELQRIAPYLISHGVTADQISGFDPTDQNLQFIYMQGMDLDKLATIEHQERQQAETERHNRAQEGNAAGNLAVRQGALGLARQREGRVASKKGGSEASGSDREALINSLIAN